MNDLAAQDFRRILLIKPSSPGDIIHTLPVLHGLRRRYPQAHLAWLVVTPFANLIETDPALNEVIRFDRQRYGRVGRSWDITWEFLSFLRGLRKRSFDLVIDLQGLFRSGLLAWATNAPVRIGFASAREFAWIFYSHRIMVDDTDAHAADKNYQISTMLDFAVAPMDFTIPVTAADRQHATTLLAEARIGNESPYIVLVPTTRWETKCWPTERFGRLAAMLRQRHGLPSVLVGGTGDLTEGNVAASHSAGAAVNLCGRTTLRELAAIIERASVVVTADSTPMHIAAAMNRPLVALFGPTSPLRTGPYGKIEDVMRIDLPCAPCYLRKLRQCAYGQACMLRLTVEAVAESVAARLAAETESNHG